MASLHPKPHNYVFKSKLIAGTTPIVTGNVYDYLMERPLGMNGFTIHLTIEGKGIIYDREKFFYSERGDMYLFPANIPHCYSRDPFTNNWKHQWVFFHPRSYWNDMLQWEKLSDNIAFYRPTSASQEIFFSLFNELLSCSNKKTPHMQLLGFNILEQILLRRIEYLPSNNEHVLDERVSAVCQYITRNISDENISIDKIASYVNLSRSRILHLFTAQMGISIFKWRDEQRMILAKRLLSESKMPISNISSKVGYEDSLYFSKVFKKYTGFGPREFRKEFNKIK